MKHWLIGLMGAVAANAALAAQLPQAPGLLPTAVVRPLLEQDPEVAAARSGLEAARQESALLDGSPYEWTAKVSTQRRKLETGPSYQEWNAGVERTLRLPGKASADRRIGQAVLEEGEARYGEALHETARELLGLWLDWLHAEQGYELAVANQQAAQENLAVVQKRVKAGDAAKLDASLAQGELAEQQRAANDAKTASTVAWAKLHARFPGLTRQFATLPTALPLEAEAGFWRERIFAESDELKIAQAQLQKAQATGERLRADKIPDPTVGIYTASEVGGQERIKGIMLTIPIPGSHRSGRANKAVHATEMARQEVELKRRELESEVAVLIATAQGAYEGWQIAETGAAAMQDNARLMQRAYALGEADLQSLLAARRQAIAASQNTLAAKVAAARAYYSLLVDAHLVWDMDHE